MYYLSNYPTTHPKYNADFVVINAKVGLVKEDPAGIIIPVFVRLGPKMESFVVASSIVTTTSTSKYSGGGEVPPPSIRRG